MGMGWEAIHDNFTFSHERGPDERWGAHRTVTIQVVAMHVFLLLLLLPSKTSFSNPSTSHDVTASVVFFFNEHAPKMRQTCLSNVSDISPQYLKRIPTMPKRCPKHVPNISHNSQTCPTNVRNMPQRDPIHIPKMSKIYCFNVSL